MNWKSEFHEAVCAVIDKRSDFFERFFGIAEFAQGNIDTFCDVIDGIEECAVHIEDDAGIMDVHGRIPFCICCEATAVASWIEVCKTSILSLQGRAFLSYFLCLIKSM